MNSPIKYNSSLAATYEKKTKVIDTVLPNHLPISFSFISIKVNL
jgi:hypothetical protein